MQMQEEISKPYEGHDVKLEKYLVKKFSEAYQKLIPSECEMLKQGLQTKNMSVMEIGNEIHFYLFDSKSFIVIDNSKASPKVKVSKLSDGYPLSPKGTFAYYPRDIIVESEFNPVSERFVNLSDVIERYLISEEKCLNPDGKYNENLTSEKQYNLHFLNRFIRRAIGSEYKSCDEDINRYMKKLIEFYPTVKHEKHISSLLQKKLQELRILDTKSKHEIDSEVFEKTLSFIKKEEKRKNFNENNNNLKKPNMAKVKSNQVSDEHFIKLVKQKQNIPNANNNSKTKKGKSVLQYISQFFALLKITFNASKKPHTSTKMSNDLTDLSTITENNKKEKPLETSSSKKYEVKIDISGNKLNASKKPHTNKRMSNDFTDLSTIAKNNKTQDIKFSKEKVLKTSSSKKYEVIELHFLSL